ncbi:TetR/AcrR family transcriptional regulator C-terminal domain-containing protein [Miltoncostaea marina]|uniref:TetR/AcrR family transcriptional regulator C-terminal domain-containing protein n=1 Tax=Miltoncostaea marina TaxID=2843215 RepID=UPI001C3DD112|nr:TetR/AcrR family transcriptional regulator C-terminal domain-containing protein [Miltoncostaea marina]
MAGPPTSPGAPRRRRPLTRAEILGAALALIDERGLHALSMRALGARPGVEAMALSRHVAGTRGVLEGVVDMLLAEPGAGPRPSGGWREVLAGRARGCRRLLRAHPRAVALLSGRPERSDVAAREASEWLLRHLCACAFGEDDAVRAVRLVNRCVMGVSLDERPAGDDERGGGAARRGRTRRCARCSPTWRDPAAATRGSSSPASRLLDGLERRLGALAAR